MLSHTATHTHRNGLLSPYHSYYGTIENMMVSYLQPFPSVKQNKLSQVSHIHLDLIWLPLFMLWSFSHSSSPCHLSSHLSLSLAPSLLRLQSFTDSAFKQLHVASTLLNLSYLTAIPSLSPHVLSFLISFFLHISYLVSLPIHLHPLPSLPSPSLPSSLPSSFSLS